MRPPSSLLRRTREKRARASGGTWHLSLHSAICCVGAVACAASSFLAAPRALADDTHYHDYPIGARAVGLGGAFTALADDPSGVYYNPAGIVDVREASVEVSTNLYGIELINADLLTSIADIESVVTKVNVIPTTAGAIKVLNGMDDRGRAETAYGIGVFVPSYRSLKLQSLSDVGGTVIQGCDRLAYQRSTLDQTFWLGAALAHRLTNTIRLGMGAFVTHRSLLDREESACFKASGVTNAAFASVASDLDLSATSLLVSVGVKVELAKDLFFGAHLVSPSVGVYESATLRVTRALAAVDEGRSHFLLDDLYNLRASSRTAPSLRIGIAKLFARGVLVVDASVHGPVRYRLVDIPADRPEVRRSLTLVNDVARRPVANVHLGAEWQITPSWSVASGLFSNIPSSDEIPGSTGARFDGPRLPHVKSVGGSLILGYLGAFTMTRLGVTASYGRGANVVVQQDGLRALAEDPAFIKSPLRQLFLFVYLSSTLTLDRPVPGASEDSEDSDTGP